jgi:esterase/lipase
MKFKEMYTESLRSIEVTFDDGSKLTTDMAKHLTDKEMSDYYKIGKPFNVGIGGKDKMVKVKSIKILK